jgi:hypothetical protein
MKIAFLFLTLASFGFSDSEYYDDPGSCRYWLQWLDDMGRYEELMIESARDNDENDFYEMRERIMKIQKKIEKDSKK